MKRFLGLGILVVCLLGFAGVGKAALIDGFDFDDYTLGTLYKPATAVPVGGQWTVTTGGFQVLGADTYYFVDRWGDIDGKRVLRIGGTPSTTNTVVADMSGMAAGYYTFSFYAGWGATPLPDGSGGVKDVSLTIGGITPLSVTDAAGASHSGELLLSTADHSMHQYFVTFYLPEGTPFLSLSTKNDAQWIALYGGTLAVATPEPAAFLLFGVGAVGLLVMRRVRRNGR